jgi:predicted benzoate:H+ symporter BenE
MGAPPLGNWYLEMKGVCRVYVGVHTMWVRLPGVKAWSTPPLVVD